MADLFICVVPPLALCAGLGVWIIVHTLRGIAEGLRAARWPYTSGTVLSIESKKSTDGDGRELLVTYSYNVGNRSYEGTRVHPIYPGSSFEEADKGLEAILTAGKKVRVYYRSDSPTTSTLSVGFFSVNLAGVFAGLIFSLMGLGFLIVITFEKLDVDMTITTVQGRIGMALAGLGLVFGWSLMMWFAWMGNKNFAAGITVGE